MSVFCIAKSDALVLVSDTGDIGWGCGLLPAGKGTQVVVVRGCVLLPIKAQLHFSNAYKEKERTFGVDLLNVKIRTS